MRGMRMTGEAFHFPAFAPTRSQSPRRRRWRRRRRRQPSTAKPQPPTVTTIHSLGDDLLREIFLRLPSLPSLVRAALTCRGFLAAVRSYPAFRRRFRALHQPPLLGFFFESIGEDFPSFSPIRRRSDPDMAAAVRGMDVFLTRVPYHEDASPGWRISECRGGCLLLLNRETEQIAVYNPLTRALDFLPAPPEDIFSGRHGKFYYMDFFLLYSDHSRDSFRVVAPGHDKSRMRASIFSSDTKEWQILPWSEIAPAQPSGKKHWLLSGTQVNGNLYWAHIKQAYMVVLDTATMQFSFIDLPEHLKGQGYLYKLGGAKDGKLCMVSVVEFTLCTWFRRADGSSAEKWMLHNVIPLEGEILHAMEIPEDELSEHLLSVQAVLDGIVYMSILGEHTSPSWFLSFCLETRKLEKLFHRTFDNRVYPHIMGWPSLLIGDDIDVALDSAV